MSRLPKRLEGLVADFLPNKNAEVGQDPHFVVMDKNNPDLLWQQNHCGLFKSTNAGKTWENYSEKPGVKSSFGWAIAIDETDPNIVYTIPALSDITRVPVEYALFVQKSTDGGETWKIQTDGLPQENCYDIVYRHCLALKNKKLIFGTTTGNFYSSDNEGDKWSLISAHLPPIYSLDLT